MQQQKPPAISVKNLPANSGRHIFTTGSSRKPGATARATPAGDFYQYWASRAFLEKALHHRTGSGNRRSLQPGLETLLDLSACDPGFLQALPHRRIHPGTLLWEGEFQRTFYNSWTQAG